MHLGVYHVLMSIPVSPSKNIAVIGGGVAGILSAYLLSKKHRVTLFEKNNYVGGHTNSISIPSGPDAGVKIDTGFIVLNDKTYPTLHKFLRALDVPVRWSNMSFGFYDCNSGLQYAGVNLNSLFAQRRNMLSGRFVKMLLEIRRFCQAGAVNLSAISPDIRLKDFLAKHAFSKELIHDYVVPIGAAIWSAPDEEMLEFPAITFLRFFSNHGLLSLQARPRWQTVVGGSSAYVDKFLAQFSGSVRTDCSVQNVRREADSVVLRSAAGESSKFDGVVFATHADVTLKLLDDADGSEKAALTPWRYQDNLTILHTDESFLPPNKRAWASWNYRREIGEKGNQPVSVTYHMNRLQGLETKDQYCVTLNPRQHPAAAKVIYEVLYRHPVYSLEAVNAQHLLPSIQGKRRSWFCGSYHGYGFHEDAAMSAAAVAAQFGIEL